MIYYHGMTNGKPSFMNAEGRSREECAAMFIKREIPVWTFPGANIVMPSAEDVAAIASKWWGYRNETLAIIARVKECV